MDARRLPSRAVVTRWYEAPERPFGWKGVVVRAFDGPNRALVRVTGPAVVVDYVEQFYRLREVTAPLVGDP